MEMNQIRYFLAAADALNFTKAAKGCGVSQPALTKAIQTLESELGGELFDRASRPMRLTALGLALRDRFVEVMQRLGDIQTYADRHLDPERARCAVGVLNTIDHDLVRHVLNQVRAELVDVLLVVKHANHADVLADMRNGVALMSVTTITPDIEARYHTRVLFEEPYVVVLPPSSPLRSVDAVRGADLADLPYVERLHCEKSSDIVAALRARDCSLKTVMSSDQDSVVFAAVQDGLGVTLSPRSLAQRAPAWRPLAEPDVTRRIGLAARHDVTLTEPARAVWNRLACASWPDPAAETSAATHI